MKVVLLSVLIAAPVFASGMTVCEQWEVVDAGTPPDSGVAEDGGAADKQASDAGPPSIYRAPARRCVKYGYHSYSDRVGCSSASGESLMLLALLMTRLRRKRS